MGRGESSGLNNWNSGWILAGRGQIFELSTRENSAPFAPNLNSVAFQFIFTFPCKKSFILQMEIELGRLFPAQGQAAT